jgi:hypothetical protein
MGLENSMRAWLVAAGVASLLGLLAGSAWGQVTDYSAGKTPAQLFSSDCAACHQSARGLAKGRDQRSLASFLREHYTTKAESAGALAAFLAGAPAAAATPAEGRNGRQGTARVQPPKPVPGAPDQEDAFPYGRRQPGDAAAEPGAISAPEAGTPPENRRARPSREAAKPAAGKGKKADPTEAAKEAAREEAAREAAVKAKVRAYATTGEEARARQGAGDVAPGHPAIAPGGAPGAQPAAPPGAAAGAAAAPVPPEATKPSEPQGTESKSTEPNAAPAAPSGSERPASTPPG